MILCTTTSSKKYKHIVNTYKIAIQFVNHNTSRAVSCQSQIMAILLRLAHNEEIQIYNLLIGDSYIKKSLEIQHILYENKCCGIFMFALDQNKWPDELFQYVVLRFSLIAIFMD